MLLGTAGHIDHGKTALVHALTGIWTDRLKEERERGISIDLGFAHWDVEPGLRIGIVDVPGHVDFIRNMVAGASGVDAALFVVSAEEGMMPQSREHLAILEQLGVRRGVVALTKRDMVEDEWLELVSAAVGEELSTSFLGGAPRVAVSVRSGEGLDALRAELAALARAAPAPEGSAALDFRMPVDRAFTVRGVGTVVTGTPRSGRLRTDDVVRILPGDVEGRVRSIESHGTAASEAVPGRRTALALGGVERSAVARGSVIVSGRRWRAGRLFQAQLRLARGAEAEIRSGARVRILLGTSEVMARVTLERGASPIRPGGSAFAQLRTEADLVAGSGDPFVLRTFSPVATIGGGTILWRSRRRMGPRALREAEDFHRALASGAPAARLVAAVQERGGRGLPVAEAAFLAGVDEAAAIAVAEELRTRTEVVQEGGRLFPRDAVSIARDRIVAQLEAFHAREHVRRGMSLGELRERVGSASAIFERALRELTEENRAAADHNQVRLASRGEELGPREAHWRDALLALYADAGLEPPGTTDALASVGAPHREGRALLERLAQDGGLTKIAADFYVHAAPLSGARERVRALLAERPEASVGELKDALGLSRKYLIPLLEHFDREGLTRRTPGGRALARR